MRKIFNDDVFQAKFLATGFVQVPMLSASQIEHILSQLGSLKPADNFAPGGADGFYQEYHCSFLDKSVAYKRHAFDLIGSVFTQYVESYLHGYRILSSNFYVKPPGTGTFVIHQNWPTIPNLNDTTVTIWCPLTDVVESNGALQFVAGSHKILPHVEGPVAPAYFDKFRQTLIEKHLKPRPMPAGDALIFDDGLLHWSANNDTDKARVAIQIACVPVDVPAVFFFFDHEHQERFELIEAEPEFWLASDILDLTRRQSHWKSLGFVENKNRLVTEAEFCALLENGPSIRAAVYATGENPLKTVFVDTPMLSLPERGYTIAPLLDETDLEALSALHAETTPTVPMDYYVSAHGSDSEVRRRIFEGITSIVANKVDRLVPGYRILMASFVTKKANGTRGILPIHQDYSFVDQDKYVGINIWAPLVDTSEQNGQLRNIDYSPRSLHISACPPNPAPFTPVCAELETDYLSDTPMARGDACIFDTRVLHTTEPNRTGNDRTAVFLNLVPTVATPRMYFYKPENPRQLEVYEVDSEFLLHLKPNVYPEQSVLKLATFRGMLGYDPKPWASSDLASILSPPSHAPAGLWSFIFSFIPKLLFRAPQHSQ